MTALALIVKYWYAVVIAALLVVILGMHIAADQRDATIASLKAANESSRKANLTTTNGFRTPQQMTGEQAIAAKADDLRKTDPKLTKAQAIEKALTEDDYLATLRPGSGAGALPN